MDLTLQVTHAVGESVSYVESVQGRPISVRFSAAARSVVWGRARVRSASPLRGWVALSIAVLVGALFLTLVPSRAVAVAAGVMSAGAIGNLISARLDGNWVPNPLVIGDYQRGIAFNLADVFFLVGNMLLMTALIVMLVRRRDRLAPPRAWERALLRQLRVGG
jgi:Signal peptidase (SPase) II